MSEAIREALPNARPSAAHSERRRWLSAVARIGNLVGLNQSTSLARRFLLASLLVLVVGGLLIGWWVGNQLERGIIDRSAAITALYAESFVEPSLASLEKGEWLSASDKAQLDAILTSTPFAQKIVAMKVWRPDDVVVYSPDRALIGQHFEPDEKLQAALNGTVIADMSNLEDEENVNERARGFDHLLEMYIPIRESGGGRIIAVAEFYQVPTEIDQEVGDAQVQSWLAVTGGVAIVYLFLFGIVRGGSKTIERQQVALQEQVTELQTLLDQNEQLRERIRHAAERSTTLSERQLRRISSDLHDGPGQMLALAMLRIDELERSVAADTRVTADIRAALEDALRDMRAIAAGLRLPELRGLSTADTLRRVVDDHSRRTAAAVSVDIGELPAEATLPTKIALFRAAQELLSNATRHGGAKDVSVELRGDARQIELTVSDAGPGFDASFVGAEGHLGLAGIREQAELLGGGFEVRDRPGGGASVIVRWPR